MKHEEERRLVGRSSRGRRAGVGLALLVICYSAFCRASQDSATTPPQHDPQLFARAQRLVEQKHYLAAAQVYEQIIRTDPRSFEALNNLGVLEAHLGKYAQAADAYERALRLKPRSFPLLVNLGLCYFKNGNFKSAVKPLAGAVSQQPENFQARTLLAMSYYSDKDFKAASAEFERAIALKPDNQTLQYLLAQSYLESKQDQKLLNFFQQLLRRFPKSFTIDMLLGEADDGLDRDEEAIQEFKAAAALAPNQPNVHFGLGYLYWKNHDYVHAAEAFQREIESGGAVAKSEAYLGDIDLKQGKLDQARALIGQALRLYPKIRIAHYDLGILDAQEKRYGPAVMELQEAIRLDPSRADAHYRLAQVYRAAGKDDLAKEELSAVTGIHQKTADSLYKEISGTPPPAAAR